MILRMTLDRPIHGYWDGGAKTTFDFTIDGPVCQDAHGAYCRVGSWAANQWFNVACGKTAKATLGHARRRLAHRLRKAGIPAQFAYIDDGTSYFERQAYGERQP